MLEANGISHHDTQLTDDEEMTPTVESIIVLMWLKLIHPELPMLVKQRYGTELRSQSLESIKPEISQAMDSLLDELHSVEDAKVMRAAAASSKRDSGPRANMSRPAGNKSCPLCKQTSRRDYNTHFLSQCKFLPPRDRQYLSRARQVMGTDSDLEEEEFTTELERSNISLVSTELSTNRRVQVKQSPFLDTFYKHFPIRVTIDSWAETNLIKSSLVQRIGACLKPSAQKALQADGSTPLTVRGETTIILQWDNLELELNALIVDEIDVDVLAGVPFMTTKDIAVRPAKHQVMIGDKKICKYEPTRAGDNTSTVSRAQSYLVRAPNSTTTLWPCEFLELTVLDSLDECIAIEPCCDSWPMMVSWPGQAPQ